MRRVFAPLVLASLLLPTTPSANDVALPSWLAERGEDALWLTQSGERPRAIIDLWDNGVEVVLYLPGLDPATVVSTIERYDIYFNTDMVESAYCADGAFFTGSRLTAVGIDVFSPTVTTYAKTVGSDHFTMSWGLLSVEKSADYVRAHRNDMEKSLKDAGLEREVDEYIAETVEKLGAIASVEGSHRYEGGFYAYKQEIHSASKFHESLVRSFGAKPQLRAALKSALFSAGRVDLAGKAGDKGAKFDLRGGSYDTIRPGT